MSSGLLSLIAPHAVRRKEAKRWRFDTGPAALSGPCPRGDGFAGYYADREVIDVFVACARVVGRC